jgi:regulatory protein
MAAQPPSLKARALKMLALRELSAAELKRKLLPVATEMGQGETEVDALVAELQAKNWQSDARFAQSLARRRSKYGSARLAQELRQHGLDKEAAEQTLDAARESDYARALEAWQKKFHGELPASAQERAKQMRFLAARGFGAEVVRRVLKGEEDLPSLD